ncbi:UDP-glucose dehydrogenase family protein [Paenibacillus gansuensis]|uniref:UDP-glucose 6-dehydrogenase n=1 Tax=Paenibacillus gansuensis TaxID=306542 RepID=A0ABW5PBP9_9BACL
MNILIIGTGYVGTTTALVFAEMGWKVTGLDTELRKIENLRQGLLYFYEPGLDEMLIKHTGSGRLQFTTDKAKAIRDNDVIFICVGTPSRPDGSADLRYVQQVAEDIGEHMNGYKLIVNKSTVPVGTQERVTDWVREAQVHPHPYDVASNPEFLREGKALEDALHPERIVIGADSDHASGLLQQLYASINCPVIVTSPRTAELIKYASNAFLAAKISFVNELARLCDPLEVNIKEVALGMGLDSRIGPKFLQAGIGYGGSCFPKDVAALLLTAQELNVRLQVLQHVVDVNQTQYLYLLDKVRNRLGTLAHKKIALFGLAFKPDTDDIREAPAVRIIQTLLQEEAEVRICDPVAQLPAELKVSSVAFSTSPEEVLDGADAVLLCTEWPMFRDLDWTRLKDRMSRPNLFDGRNFLDAGRMTELGFYYEGIGYK